MSARQTTFVMIAVLLVIGQVPIGAAGVSRVRGILQKIDLENGIITLQIGAKNAPNLQSFSLSSPKIPVISQTGGDAKLADLQPGLNVTLQLSEANDVEAVVVKAPTLGGLLHSYNPQKRIITVHGGKIGKKGSYQVTDKTTANIYGHKMGLDKLRPGQRLLMVMSLDQKTVLSLVANLKRGPFDPRGTLVGIDADKGTLSLLEGKDGRFRLRTFAIDPNYVFLFNGYHIKDVKLPDLPVVKRLDELLRSAPTWFSLDEAGKNIQVIRLTSPSIRGTLQSIDAKRQTVIVKYDNGKSETFLIEQDIEMRVKHKRIRLDKLQPGTVVDLRLSYRPGRLSGISAAKD